MRLHEYKEITEQHKYLKKLICDMCQTEFDNDDWNAGNYEIKDTTVSLEEGNCYPDSYDTEEIYCDICPDCFRTKLIPWLESQGVKMIKKEKCW